MVKFTEEWFCRGLVLLTVGCGTQEATPATAASAGDSGSGVPEAGVADAEAGPAPIQADCHDRWCAIPPGTYTKGSPASVVGGSRATAQGLVTITRPFLIQQFETTVPEWLELSTGRWRPLREATFPQAEADNPDSPLVGVTWSEAALFANRLSAKRGLPGCYKLDECREVEVVNAGVPVPATVCEHAALANVATAYECEGFRLPTQAEWEYAARAGTTTESYAGDQDAGDLPEYKLEDCIHQANLVDIAWYCFNSDDLLHPVGMKAPNAFGLYDMLGNSYEWAHGHYKPWASPETPLLDPLGELDPNDITRVDGLGGGFRSGAGFTRAAHHLPVDRLELFTAGIRLARTLKPGENWKETP